MSVLSSSNQLGVALIEGCFPDEKKSGKTSRGKTVVSVPIIRSAVFCQYSEARSCSERKTNQVSRQNQACCVLWLRELSGPPRTDGSWEPKL